MFQISITGEGLLDPARLASWSLELQRQINQRAKQGMTQAMPQAKAAIRGEIDNHLNVKKKGFANTMRGQVVANDADRLPLGVFYSKAAWLSAHVQGATIRGGSGKGVLIPFNLSKGRTRLGYRAFQRMIRQLDAQGNLNFVKVRSGNVMVFAETAGSGGALNKHNKRVGADVGKRKRKRSVEVPVAVFVPVIKLRKRLDFAAVAKQISRDMAIAVQGQLDRP